MAEDAEKRPTIHLVAENSDATLKAQQDERERGYARAEIEFPLLTLRPV
jgi:hypothetical protein